MKSGNKDKHMQTKNDRIFFWSLSGIYYTRGQFRARIQVFSNLVVLRSDSDHNDFILEDRGEPVMAIWVSVTNRFSIMAAKCSVLFRAIISQEKSLGSVSRPY